MIFRSFASSSAGNAYAVSDGETSILIECGIPYKKLLKALEYKIERYSACLLSHSHKDHSKAASELIKDGMAIYTSEGTAGELGLEGMIEVEHGEQFNVGSFDIVPFNTFHDCSEPLGFLIKSRKDGEALVFATDTVNLRYRFPGMNILAIEANYFRQKLDRSQKLPEKTKHRIENTHMEIHNLCEYLRELDLGKCKKIYLLHLSDGMSDERLFFDMVSRVVPAQTKVYICEK